MAQVQPDVLCLQETKLADDAFPALTFQALGYESAHHGFGPVERRGHPEQGRASTTWSTGFDDDDAPDPDARLVWATCGGVRVASAYVPNGRALTDDHYQYKLAWLARLRALLDATGRPGRDRWPSAATSTSPPTTATCGTRPSSSTPPTSARPSARRCADIEEWGLSRRLPAPLRRAAACSRGGTTGPATSTRARACASTWSWPRPPLAERSTSVAHRPQRPQGQVAQRPRAGGRRLRPLTPAAWADGQSMAGR